MSDTENKEDIKPKVGAGGIEADPFIQLRAMDVHNSEVNFKIKMSTTMLKMKKSYAERKGVPVDKLRFQYDGRPVKDTDTPSSLGMDNDDVIDVFQEMIGG